MNDKAPFKIAIVGEFQPQNKTHQLLNLSLDWLNHRGEFTYEWLDTDRVEMEGKALLRGYSGIWSAPGSPFKSLEGALEAIRVARANNIPHLGTCAGFQHTIVEFARNVLGHPGAQHEEYDGDASELFISRLSCSLRGKTMSLRILEGSLAYECYGTNETTEDYYCNFGINPKFRSTLVHPSLKISGLDQENEIRIIEIPGNDFFLATLFVPQSKATQQSPHPVIRRFIEAAERLRGTGTAKKAARRT